MESVNTLRNEAKKNNKTGMSPVENKEIIKAIRKGKKGKVMKQHKLVTGKIKDIPMDISKKVI